MPTIWLDTDIGSDVDDAVAVLCAARHPQIELIGVSTVIGRVEIRTWLVGEMLARAGMGEVPVLSGAMASLANSEVSDQGMPSYGRLAPELPPLSPDEDDGRIDAIAEAMLSVAEPFHLLTIGPITNAARLLDRHPAVAAKWESTTCMAGRLEGQAEYNVQCDPPAAKLVCESLAPRLVGLEACSDTLTREEAEAALDPSDPASAFLLDCYRHYRGHASWHRDPESAPLTLFDAITLLSLARPDAFDFQSIHVLVEKDGRMRLTDDGAAVTYALSSNWATLKPLILALLRGSTPRGAAS